jgi:arylsulfatase
MAVYAAQISAMDRGIGQIMDACERQGILDNTLIIFLSDNGGCAEFLREDGEEGTWPEFYGQPTNRGTMCRVGNSPDRQPGPAETFMSYDLPWANASNSPFRKFKSWTNEGGISTSFIAHWPQGQTAAGAISHATGHVTDLAATIYAACGAPYLSHRGDTAVQELPGKDLLPVWRGEQPAVHADNDLFWEHQGQGAVRRGQWKLVRSSNDHPWELYDLASDRTELTNLAADQGDLVGSMAAAYQDWAERIGVRPWPLKE